MEKNNSILSIIILNYNTGNYLKQCLQSLYRSQLKDYQVEIIVVDNMSKDNSIALAQKITPILNTKYLILNTNLGFAHGNNQGIKIINPSAKYVLFLNPDTTVEKDTIYKIIDLFEKNTDVDAATCFITLATTGKMQPECHRGFPSAQNAFWHFFGLGLPKLFPKSKSLNGYFASYLDMTKTHQIDACVGAFLMVKKKVGEAIGWWNEKYFFYGEDIDFCYRLKQKGYKLFFYPHCKITHYQGVSSGLISKSKHLSRASRTTKIKIAKASTNAMKIFYKDYLLEKYPPFFRPLIISGIDLLQLYRVFKAKYL